MYLLSILPIHVHLFAIECESPKLTTLLQTCMSVCFNRVQRSVSCFNLVSWITCLSICLPKQKPQNEKTKNFKEEKNTCICADARVGSKCTAELVFTRLGSETRGCSRRGRAGRGRKDRAQGEGDGGAAT